MQKKSIEKLSEIMYSRDFHFWLNLIRNNSKLNEEFFEDILKILPQSKADAISVMKAIRAGFEYGLDIEQIKLYAKPDFNYKQMIQIMYGLKNGLNNKQICFYAKPEFDGIQMFEIRKGFEEGLSTKEISVYAKPEFWPDQMDFLKSVFKEKNLTIDQVELFADPRYGTALMEKLCSALEDGLTIEEVKEAKKFNMLKFDIYQIDMILFGYFEGLTTEQVKVYANPKFDPYQMGKIIEGFKSGLTEEQVKCYAKPEFNTLQMDRICSGLEEGYLSVNQSDIYANTLFNESQTAKVVDGYLNGLTTEQIKFYAKPKFDSEQMYQIRIGFENGLSLNDVMKFSNISKVEEMERVRTSLEKELFTEELAKLLHIN